MIQTLIISNTKNELEEWIGLLPKLKEVEVKGLFEDLEAAAQYIHAGNHIDLVFTPFTTGNQRAANAHLSSQIILPIVYVGTEKSETIPSNIFGLGYLSYPVTLDSLKKFIWQWQNCKSYFSEHQPVEFSTSIPKRILAKKGIEFYALDIHDIVYFFTQEKLVFAITSTGQKLICEKNLTTLEQELSEHLFFRANRQCLVNFHYIKSFRTYEKVRIELNLKTPEKQKIIVSQDNTSFFRKWIAQQFI
jgi:DNA-binding LytR/AlgR family response regulator